FYLQDSAPSEISTLSLHDALPICVRTKKYFHSLGFTFMHFSANNRKLKEKRYTLKFYIICALIGAIVPIPFLLFGSAKAAFHERSEEHTSELQSRENLVCRLLLET